MDHWFLVYENFDPEQEGLREALCTLGNGYFATRGAAAESEADNIHYPGTYLAGGYNRLSTEIAGRVVENEDLVNLPNWLALRFRVNGGEWYNLRAVEILSYRQELNLREGVLARTVRFRDKRGHQTLLRERRLVHMRQPHLAALEITLTAENWSGPLIVRTALDGEVVNAGVERYRQLNNQHLEPLSSEQVTDDTIALMTQTSQSRIRIAQAASTRVYRNGNPEPLERELLQRHLYVAQQFAVDLREKDEVTIEKTVALCTSRDPGVAECGGQASKQVRRQGRFRDLLKSHAQAWRHLWERFDIEVEKALPDGDDQMGIALHLHWFHLLQTTSVHTIDLDVGVPARGWHGEAYRGHIFWDELFIFPTLNFRIPEVTRGLLKYRYRRLDEARANAREAGYRGAMYPWQSGSDGREETQRLHLNPRSGRWKPDNSRRQRHVNAAIAYNIWDYYQVTGDREFISYGGAEMFFELARFWASLATYNAGLGRYEILGVMGPDEYHDGYPGAEPTGLNNNAYTNVMAVWVLVKALEVVDLLTPERRRELFEDLDLSDDEIRQWDEISRKMRVVFHDDGIISQFEGYDDLEEFDWEAYREKYGNIQRLDRILDAEGLSANQYKVSKQADVLMLFYLFSSEQLAELFERLGYPFHYETIPRNIDYYLNRTSHGSTLSHVVHSWVLARSDRARAWELLKQALGSDIADVQGGTTAEGIHLGAMAGTVNLVQQVTTGLELRQEVLRFNPYLPDDLKGLRMRIRYRGHSLEVDLTPEVLTISALASPAPPITLGFRDETCELRAGETKGFRLGANTPTPAEVAL